MDVLIQNPKILKNFLPENLYFRLINEIKPFVKNFYYDGFGRYTLGDMEEPLLKECVDFILPMARLVFNSETLLPTYSLFVHYEKRDSTTPWLIKHKDDNACTYTLDMCVYQTETWDLYVEGKPYSLRENEALAYYGCDQEHWREVMNNPEGKYVAMIFFHFAEPSHWFFTKGKNYIDFLREQKNKL